MLTIYVNAAKAYVKIPAVITTGMIGENISFVFSSEWSGLSKTAVFNGGGVAKSVLVENDRCVIPGECLVKAETSLVVGVYGTNGTTVVIPTISCNTGIIRQGTIIEGDGSTITPSLADQFLAAAGQVTTDKNIVAGYKTEAEQSASSASLDASAAQSSRIAAEAARDAAVVARTGAETAETASETARDGSVAAKTAAETARAGAESAQTGAGASAQAAAASQADALASKNAAASSASAAQSSAAAADTAKTDAQTAQTAAETAKNDAITAKTDAQTAQSVAETAKGDAITAKNDAVTAKTAAETARTDAQTAKADAVAAKTAAETAKNDAVTAKTAAETDAGTATSKATEAAQSASAADTAKTAAETAKTSAETASGTATAKATEAGNSAAAAAGSASSAARSASDAAISAQQAAAGQVNSDWNVTDAANKAYILNKPDLLLKADKKIPSAAGNLATLDANGNLADSGKAVAALEPFVITATRGALTDGVYEITHDKTLAEIYAAYQANKRVIVSLTGGGGTQTMYELSTVLNSSAYIFSAWFAPTGSVAVNAWLNINQDYGGWTAYQYPILDSGGTMEGDLTLAADPTAALGAATKQYVDAGDAAKLGTSGDGSNVTAAFTQATSRANIATGEKLSVILGKIMKWFSDLGTAAFVSTSATPASGGKSAFTTGGAYTQLAAKQATTNSLTAETELEDEDYVPFYDASASAHRKTPWSNIKAVLETYFDLRYAPALHSHSEYDQALYFTSIAVAASAFVSDTTYTNWPYRAPVALTGVTADMVPDVMLAPDDAAGGVLAPVAACYAGGIYLYANAVPTAALTIPTVECRKAVS